ncbi:MAG: hypothetical protein ACI87O_001366 [Planctomycetota bacterium]|jgi:hypothetical protein
MASHETFDFGVPSCVESGTFDEQSQAPHRERWMCFLGGDERMLNTDVNTDGAAFEPRSAARRHGRRLGLLEEPEYSHIKGSGEVFSANGYRQLDVIYPDPLGYPIIRFT